MKHKNFSQPRYYLDVPMEVMEALMRKSGEIGFRPAGYNSAAYLVEVLSQLTVEDLEAVLKRNDLLPQKERKERRCMICGVPVSQCCC